MDINRFIPKSESGNLISSIRYANAIFNQTKREPQEIKDFILQNASIFFSFITSLEKGRHWLRDLQI